MIDDLIGLYRTVNSGRTVMNGVMLAGKASIAFAFLVAVGFFLTYTFAPKLYSGPDGLQLITWVLYALAGLLLFAFFSFLAGPVALLLNVGAGMLGRGKKR
ncbi:Uncharacterised protein [uncultured archaeon]|nr:Uncharacterised protein [uncultured archaeon]